MNVVVSKKLLHTKSFNRIGKLKTYGFSDHTSDTYPTTSANLSFHVKITTNKLWTTTYSDYQLFLYKRIISLQKEGLGYKIAKILNNEGLKTPRGKVFKNTHVFSIVKKKNIRDKRISKEFNTEVSTLELEYIDP